MQYFTQKDGALVFRRRQELLEIRPWGEGLRVRATQNRTFTDRDWALSIPAPAEGRIEIFEDHAEVSNGKIKAVITDFGKMRFLDQDGKELLKEYRFLWMRSSIKVSAARSSAVAKLFTYRLIK